MPIKLHTDLIQGTDEWLQARCGLLTASEMKHIITPAQLKYSNSEKERTHLYELLGQRITKHVEPRYIGDDMLRGEAEEIHAKDHYRREYGEIQEVGFITNDKWGFTLGYSPDGLIGERGTLEIKSRCQKYQVETILAGAMPDDFRLQVQTGLLVSERDWCDFVSYCGGMPMVTIRVEADPVVQKAILEAASLFHGKMTKLLKEYADRLAAPNGRFITTERIVEQEMELTTDD